MTPADKTKLQILALGAIEVTPPRSVRLVARGFEPGPVGAPVQCGRCGCATIDILGPASIRGVKPRVERRECQLGCGAIWASNGGGGTVTIGTCDEALSDAWDAAGAYVEVAGEHPFPVAVDVHGVQRTLSKRARVFARESHT